MKYKWLLLDADGTLFDYDRAETKALAQTFTESGHPFQQQYVEVYRQINGQLWLDFEQGKIAQERLKVQRFEQLLEAVGATLDAGRFSEQYLKNLGGVADLFEGAEEVVRSLHGTVGLVLITNGLARVQRSRLAKSTIKQYFAAVVISEEVGASKPDGRIFDAAFEKMGHPEKGKVLIVGDSLTSDMRGGSEYGIDTCWFNPKGKAREPGITIRYEICKLQELTGIVREA
ncbi:MAG: YjjG family noncanonical pyrimidine nucleotidase [Anaerolineae bacterium]|nr:YjjG family noncanonical pyrimidine nucleotidase [Anaerolineae bacterium]